MRKYSKYLPLVISVCVVIGFIFAAYAAIRKDLTPTYMHSALADEVKKTKEEVKQTQADVKQAQKDLEIHRKVNWLEIIRGRIITIKERHGERPKEKTIREELTNLELEKKQTEEYIKEKSK